MSTETTATAEPTLERVLTIIHNVDEWLDSDVAPDYRTQPLAHDWARITKVCEEAGEVWKALSRETGENPRKGFCGTEDETLGEVADVVCSGLFAIQHRTKDNARTAEVVMASLEKAAKRAAEAGYGD
jgi:NTP pyrophosphatase (non-canonical NTP hydrolase)